MDESIVTLVNTFRQNAAKYGVSTEETQFVSDILGKFKTNLVFTFKQFQLFYEYWRKAFDMCPYSGSFRLYPKDCGLHLDGYTMSVYIKLLALSSVYYRPMFGPGFIDDLRMYYKAIKHNHGKLVVLSDDPIDRSNPRNGMFSTFGQESDKLFIGGGRVYHEPSARPMGELADINKSVTWFKYIDFNESEGYILCLSKDRTERVLKDQQSRKRWKDSIFKELSADQLQRIINDYIVFDSEDTEVTVCHDGKWSMINVQLNKTCKRTYNGEEYGVLTRARKRRLLSDDNTKI